MTTHAKGLRVGFFDWPELQFDVVLNDNCCGYPSDSPVFAIFDANNTDLHRGFSLAIDVESPEGTIFEWIAGTTFAPKEEKTVFSDSTAFGVPFDRLKANGLWVSWRIIIEPFFG